jgi:two-component system, OmpR family, response regulator CpxR
MRRHRLLLVDDEVNLLRAIGDFLKMQGFDVRCAETSEKAIEEMRDWKPSLVILDIGMPGIGGLGFLKHVGQSPDHPKVPVLVLTARSNMERFFADTNIADGFLSKTCTREELLGKINGILARYDLSRHDPADSAVVRCRVILGENHQPEADSIRKAFESSGMDVEVLANGQAVIERMLKSPPALLVLKEALSGLNGSVVAQMVAKMPSAHGVPVVLYDTSIAVDSPGAGVSVHTPEGVAELSPSSDPWFLVRVARRVLCT